MIRLSPALARHIGLVSSAVPFVDPRTDCGHSFPFSSILQNVPYRHFTSPSPTLIPLQVITLTGLLAHLPSSVFNDLESTETAVSREARAQEDRAFGARLSELSALRAAHKFALRPAIACPAMAAEFHELKEKVG
jgi:hypothetical protein